MVQLRRVLFPFDSWMGKKLQKETNLKGKTLLVWFLPNRVKEKNEKKFNFYFFLKMEMQKINT